MCMCVCVFACVCVRERERERERNPSNLIAPIFPGRVHKHFIVRMSHIRVVLSWFPVAKILPPGCHAAAKE